MSVSEKPEQNVEAPTVITLPEVMDVEGAIDAAKRVSEALAGGKAVALDGSGIQHIGAPGMQMLLATYLYDAKYKSAALTALSDAAMRSAEILGAAKDLHQWKEARA